MSEEVYLNEIAALQKEVELLKQDNARLLSMLRKYINNDLKQNKNGRERENVLH